MNERTDEGKTSWVPGIPTITSTFLLPTTGRHSDRIIRGQSIHRREEDPRHPVRAQPEPNRPHRQKAAHGLQHRRRSERSVPQRCTFAKARRRARIRGPERARSPTRARSLTHRQVTCPFDSKSHIHVPKYTSCDSSNSRRKNPQCLAQ
ncbi:hypothetical protein PV04_09610 [Phialophora macrospora]|uniref:Uncharacterized protein n=1 Tax=Phialophora macrospora TaxID=1851006 RepID=A0A0D2DR62_9EURO|nr:hypothetical protein PV04_09610 [Phialophora macrospora]